MAIDSVDAKGRGKTQDERSRNLGDPRKDDEKADAENDIEAGRSVGEEHRKLIEGRHGKGVHPIEGTSASNIDAPAGSLPPGTATCGNIYTGEYGRCGGVIDRETGRCRKCGIPTRDEIAGELAMVRTGDMGTLAKDIASLDGLGPASKMHDEAGSADVMRAHEKESARRVITKEVTAAVCIEMKWNPECAAEYPIVPPKMRERAAEVQRAIDSRCRQRFMAAGLLPRPQL